MWEWGKKRRGVCVGHCRTHTHGQTHTLTRAHNTLQNLVVKLCGSKQGVTSTRLSMVTAAGSQHGDLCLYVFAQGGRRMVGE